ncbi:hypothetical protein FO488_04605 [Geobacter sp. FeAm09]|uniref:DUF6268 family outer membrane beta-barrel protein n=1 Tax=Geobacter sp. FeAm09 TaxID=2597769 RepID=UPI0011EEE3C7|nr:DUF6268 family outer membrane beta-barrel protein [Geobacter sp. FeAm09]QEM67496.1 hypothetical protein FO488_04605 [Geobacter sp. FeAm09]
MKATLSTLCCMMALAPWSCALAQETKTVTEAGKEALALTMDRPLPSMEAKVDAAWLPASRVRSTGGDVTMGEVKADVVRRFAVAPNLNLSAGVGYSLREIDAPAVAGLPDALHTLSLNLGAEYRINEALTLGFRVSPAVGSDFKAFTGGDIRVPVATHAGLQVSPSLFLLGGLAYTGMNHSYPVLPVLGLVYTPAPQWTFALGFPRTGVVYRPDKETELYAGAEFSGGEYQLHDAALGAGALSYRDYRAVVGADIQVCSFARLGVAGGYAFAREFVFYNSKRGDLNLDAAPFGRVALKFAWCPPGDSAPASPVAKSRFPAMLGTAVPLPAEAPRAFAQRGRIC